MAVFLFHAAHIFDLDPEASIKNRETSVALSVYVFFADQWIMHTIFLAAGASAWFSLRTRTRSSFLRERASRLMVPFLLGTFLLIPWHGYVSAQNHETFAGSYSSYLPVHFAGIWSALQKPPLPFNSTIFFVTSWHLWFLGVLFVFSLLTTLYSGAPALRPEPWLKGSGWWRTSILGLPIVLIKLSVDARFPSHTDWSEMLVWFVLYWYGWLFMSDPTLWRDIEAQASRWLVVGIAAIGLLGLAFQQGYLMRWIQNPTYTCDYALYQILAAVNTWAWVLAITGSCFRYLNRDHQWLGYLGTATLPFYILHQTALLTIGFWIVQTRWTLFAKFAVISASSLLVTIAVYELLIRRSAFLRMIFGMKATSLHNSQHA